MVRVFVMMNVTFHEDIPPTHQEVKSKLMKIIRGEFVPIIQSLPTPSYQGPTNNGNN